MRSSSQSVVYRGGGGEVGLADGDERAATILTATGKEFGPGPTHCAQTWHPTPTNLFLCMEYEAGPTTEPASDHPSPFSPGRYRLSDKRVHKRSRDRPYEG
ncbi:hypothetical protein GCM10011374_40560 [Kocuria dechangensis]|uniref:Uncharacterized protein n=1 Tax=Kocuria dechangensis TaxID=1176249 RepID=A0A917H993_9MICC|nr:hypothetical protein GCM10011374_40560 [Kocuria dechangensis]